MKKTELPMYLPGNEVVLALALNKEDKTERVLVGAESDIRLHLEGIEVPGVWYDQVRPMGTLIVEYDSQDREWWCAEVLVPYRNALMYPRERKENEQRGQKSLEDKLVSDNAISVLCAHRTLSIYCPGVSTKRKAEWAVMFDRRMLTLVRHFRRNLLDKKDLCLEKILEHVCGTCEGKSYRDETDLRIWYPWRECDQEYAVMEDALLPLMLYYLRRLDDWGLCIRVCEVCGKIFVADSNHYCLCGDDACKKEQNRRNKREFYVRNKDDKVERLYQQKRDRIRRIVNQITKRKGVLPAFVADVEAQYEAFRNEGKCRKGAVHSKEEKEKFVDWLYEREHFFEELERKCK